MTTFWAMTQQAPRAACVEFQGARDHYCCRNFCSFNRARDAQLRLCNRSPRQRSHTHVCLSPNAVMAVCPRLNSRCLSLDSRSRRPWTRQRLSLRTRLACQICWLLPWLSALLIVHLLPPSGVRVWLQALLPPAGPSENHQTMRQLSLWRRRRRCTGMRRKRGRGA